MDPNQYSSNRWRAYTSLGRGGYLLIVQNGTTKRALIATVPVNAEILMGTGSLSYQLMLIDNFDPHTINHCPDVIASYRWNRLEDDITIEEEKTEEVRMEVLGLKSKLRGVLGLPKTRIDGLEMVLRKLEEGKVAVPT